MKKHKTNHKEGYTQEEIEALLKKYPDMDKDKFYDALGTHTGVVVDGEFLTYHSDVAMAVRCMLQNRKPRPLEWD